MRLTVHAGGKLRRTLLLLGLLFALGLDYLAILPATWFDALLQRASQGTLAMTGTKGTLWRGEGSLQAILPGGEVANLAQVNWNLAPGDLLSLRLQVRSSQDGSPILDATLLPGSIRIESARLQLPAALLGTLSPTLRAAELSGQLMLQATAVRVEANHFGGHVQVVWQAAGSTLSRVRPLGDYQLILNGQGNGLDFRLLTLNGQLSLDGSGHWAPKERPAYHLTATPTAAVRQELVPLLRMMGRETTPGSYQLTLDKNVGAV